MRQIIHEMKQKFQARNKALVSKGVLTKAIDFFFDLTYNPQTQHITVSIQQKDGALMVERNGSMQPDVMVTFSKQLASALGFQKVWYPEIREYTSTSVANVDTVNTIYVYCDVIEYRTVGHTLAPLLAVLPVTGKPGAYVSKRYGKIQYHPVLKKNLCDIHISFATIKLNKFAFARESSSDFAFTTEKTKFIIKPKCKGKTCYCKISLVAETCGSNIVVTQKHIKTIICLKSVMVWLILLGHEFNKVMD